MRKWCRSYLQAPQRSIAPVTWIVENTKAANVVPPDDIIAVEAKRLRVEGMEKHPLRARTEHEPKHAGHPVTTMNVKQVPSQLFRRPRSGEIGAGTRCRRSPKRIIRLFALLSHASGYGREL